MTIKVTERQMQTVLIRRAMHHRVHSLVIPNSREFVGNNESDLLSVTRSGLVHEYEIKISLRDYNREFNKGKHIDMQRVHEGIIKKVTWRSGGFIIPNYFWFVTYDFDITPPAYAGWILVKKDHKDRLYYREKVAAPRLHKEHLPDKYLIKIGHLLSYRLLYFYNRVFPDK